MLSNYHVDVGPHNFNPYPMLMIEIVQYIAELEVKINCTF